MTTSPRNVASRPGGHKNPNTTLRYICSWCGAYTTCAATNLSVTLTSRRAPAHHLMGGVCSAADCGKATLCYAIVPTLEIGGEVEIKTFPSARSTYAPVGVPDPIAKDFREAQDSATNGFLFGAALVARRVLQAAARHHGGTGTNLRAEIEALSADLITKALKDAAHQVRFIGNDAAHADDVTEGDVHDLLLYTEQLLHALYVMPAMVAATQARRA